ncbi:MAG: acetyl-CoA carboxylase, biotin carboxyl carrier protein [Legionellales bacterium]|nr:acetyl-CoA carboxylase, biotin carboxyl carrier protein [Legionellales bacterium]|tara:strand:- start:8527 stop:9000 length:474 start_codon:yes stop_codon:yes gene_type:complete
MDIRKIKKLIELIDETGVAEIEIKEGEEAVRISRYGSQAPVAAAPMPTMIAPAAAAAAPVNHHQPEEAPAATEDSPLLGHTVKSPMVGTMYTSPSPDADNFVKVGQRVSVGDVLCIVEAMKMFNHIEADASGVIAARLVENGQPVEYGQPLFIIEEE